MPLELTLDHPLQVISEPGYYQRIASREWEKVLNPTGTNANRAFWSDAATRTLMLQPLQLQPGWLNTSVQDDSIISLTDHGSGRLVTSDAAFAASKISEFNLKQNASNPWVAFAPTADSGLTLAETLAQLALVALDAKSKIPLDATDTRVLAYTEDDVIGNQALYLRWMQPDIQAVPAFVMGFCIGQIALLISGYLLQIFEDISPAKDRTQWQYVTTHSIFALGDDVDTSNNAASGREVPDESGAQERSIFWLPFRRNLVYLQGNGGRYCTIATRPTPALRADGLDWDIVDDNKVLVWGYSTAPSRFQIQKVKWAGPTGQIGRIPTFIVDYTPASALTSANIVPDKDQFRTVGISVGTPTTPPGYDDPVNHLNDCPPPTTDATAETRTYGVAVTFQSSADQRFTPFLYGLDIRIDKEVDTWGGTLLTTVGDTRISDAHILRASFTSSLDPGSTQLEVEVDDRSPFALEDHWYLTERPVRLRETTGPAILFTGITEPNNVIPLKYDSAVPRRISFVADSLWKMFDVPMRDQRDWGPKGTSPGEGHITVVDFLARLAGIDTTGADYPSPLADWNTPLGGADPSIPQEGALKPYWQPRYEETYGQFISRIAEQFAAFVVGFYPSGQFFYLPRVPWFYNSFEVEFKKSRATNPAGPCYEDPVIFEVVPPVANVVQVEAHDKNGNRLRSSRMVDRASISNPDAPNFIGRWKPTTYQVDGQLTCSELNRIAFRLWQRDRRRHYKVKFKADYFPALRVGRVFRLEGYAGDWRLHSYKAEYIHEGFKQASYEAALVETGYS